MGRVNPRRQRFLRLLESGCNRKWWSVHHIHAHEFASLTSTPSAGAGTHHSPTRARPSSAARWQCSAVWRPEDKQAERAPAKKCSALYRAASLECVLTSEAGPHPAGCAAVCAANSRAIKRLGGGLYRMLQQRLPTEMGCAAPHRQGIQEQYLLSTCLCSLLSSFNFCLHVHPQSQCSPHYPLACPGHTRTFPCFISVQQQGRCPLGHRCCHPQTECLRHHPHACPGRARVPLLHQRPEGGQVPERRQIQHQGRQETCLVMAWSAALPACCQAFRCTSAAHWNASPAPRSHWQPMPGLIGSPCLVTLILLLPPSFSHSRAPLHTTCTHAHTRTHARAHTHARTHTRAHARAHTRTHAHTHTHTYMLMHACTRKGT